MDDTWVIRRLYPYEITLSPEHEGAYEFSCNDVYVTRAVQFNEEDGGTWDMLHHGNEDMFRAPVGALERFSSLYDLMQAMRERWDESPRKPLSEES